MVSFTHGNTIFQAQPIPAVAGIGLRSIHHRQITDELPHIAWFEVHSENFFSDGGPAHHFLTAIREHYPVSFHGVGLSPASANGIAAPHLKRLKELVDRYQPGLVSEHLSWSNNGELTTPDLLPIPYTEEALTILIQNIKQIQDTLGRKILIENPSSYLSFTNSTMPEQEFLVRASEESGCSILLDVNNVYVSACNHHFNAEKYIQAIPPEHVGEIHLAGHCINRIGDGEVHIDDHGSRVCTEVWELYRLTLRHLKRNIPTLIEWDTNIPPLSTLIEEAELANQYMQEEYPHDLAA